LQDLKLGKRNARDWDSSEPNNEEKDEPAHSFSRLAIRKRYEAWKAQDEQSKSGGGGGGDEKMKDP